MDKVAPDKEIIEAIMEAGGEESRLCWQCGKCDVVCPWNRVRAFSNRKQIRQAGLGLAFLATGQVSFRRAIAAQPGLQGADQAQDGQSP